MDFTSGEIRGFVDAVRGEPERGECVVRGTVTRVDPDGTAWVQIGQNAEPTPCQRDMACHVGDSVTVRIADHRATVTGNATSPATDDRAAKEAHGVAVAAQASAEVAHDEAQGAQMTAMTAATTARAAETAAQEAKQSANKTFLERPVPPYRVGDVWMVAGAADYKWSAITWETWRSVGDTDWYLFDDSSKATVFKCVRSKSRGEEFDPSDWELAQDLKGTFASKSELTKSSREIRAAVKDQWTLTEGLVEQERIDREASIGVRADAILSEVKADYATKGELGDAKTSLSSTINQTPRASGQAWRRTTRPRASWATRRPACHPR